MTFIAWLGHCGTMKSLALVIISPLYIKRKASCVTVQSEWNIHIIHSSSALSSFLPGLIFFRNKQDLDPLPLELDPAPILVDPPTLYALWKKLMQ